ncbi:MAG: alpha/beta hydrolase [Bacteroidetes bacterium]|nr:alpha/beta hydrolase [Bacteroidota bacterium]
MEIKYIKTAQFPCLSYRIGGIGPVLVLIHGFPEDSEIWHLVWSKLSEKYTLVMPDLPGSGESKYEGELSIEVMADSVKAVLDNEGMDSAVIAGHSMGGYTAIAMAECYPSVFKGLSFVHSFAIADSEEKKATRRKSIALINKGGKDAFIRQMVPGLFAPSFREKSPEIIELQVKRGMEVPAESLTAFYNAMINRPDRTKTLSEAIFPVQWIVGEADIIATKELVLQQSKLANVNFVSVYPDCTHMCMLECPLQFIEDITAFTDYCYSK